MNKTQIIKELKLAHPTLTKGVNDETIKLNAEEYEATIAEWADNKLAKLTQKAEAEAQASAKSALLTKLGLTEDEAKLLLS